MREIQIEKGEKVLIKTPVMDLIFEIWTDGDHFDLYLTDSSMKFEYISLWGPEIISKGTSIKAKASLICIGKTEGIK